MIVLGHSTALHETFKHRIHLRVLLINTQIVKKKKFDLVGKADVWLSPPLYIPTLSR